MDDRTLVAGLRTGEVRGLAAVYDAYADRLLSYAGTLVPESEAVAAVHDALLVARERAEKAPELFRAWLYLLVRNECVRQRRQRRRSAPAAPAAPTGATTGTTTGTSTAADTAGDAAGDTNGDTNGGLDGDLVRTALAGLDPVERELLELSARHDLDDAELAAVLGPHAPAAAERARTRLEQTATGLSGDCAEAAGTATHRLARHVQTCPACAGTAHPDPVALLAATPFVLAPAGLRERVLGHAELIVYQQRLAERAGPWQDAGFPVPLARRRAVRRPPVRWSAAAAAVLVVLVVGGLLLTRPGGGGAPLAGTANEQLQTALPAGDETGRPPVGTTTRSSPSPSGPERTATPFPTTGHRPTPTASGSTSPTGPPSPTRTTVAPVPTTPAPTTVPTTPAPTTTPPPVPAISAASVLTSASCPDTWKARLTATVTGTTATGVNALISGGSGPSSTPMNPAGPGVWTVVVTLPADTALRFTAAAATPGGRLNSAAKSLSHACP
ncbi:MAG TPA: hypothetical protein VGP36_24855 [Mycobacteriales bacterium]|nr:hypothetical protein [Mycobacteriales bacterium]